MAETEKTEQWHRAEGSQMSFFTPRLLHDRGKGSSRAGVRLAEGAGLYPVCLLYSYKRDSICRHMAHIY